MIAKLSYYTFVSLLYLRVSSPFIFSPSPVKLDSILSLLLLSSKSKKSLMTSAFLPLAAKGGSFTFPL